MDPLTIKSVHLYHYTLPFKKPFRISRKVLLIREGLILELTDQKGNSGFGEISPLPNLNPENLKDAYREIVRLKDIFLRNFNWPDGQKDYFWKAILESEKLSASVRFGVETAVFDLCIKNFNQHPYPSGKLPSRPKNFSPTVNISGLLEGSHDEIKQEARKLIRKGFKVLKLKVGRRPANQEIALIRHLEGIVKQKARLRLDANQSWDFKAAVRCLTGINPEIIEYIEEPLQNPRMLSKLYEATQVPSAADESIRQIPLRQLLSTKGLKALVIKPTILGGFSKAFALMKEAQKRGVMAVVSSSFETGLGTIALANLAAGEGFNEMAAGLDTLKYFKQDILKKSKIMTGPVLDVRQLNVLVENIDTTRLKRLSL